MYNIVSKLLVYGDMPKDSILMELSHIFKETYSNTQSTDELSTRILKQIKKLLQIATEYGFNENLWHNYLTFLIITDENPFSLISEKIGAKDGSVNTFVLNDFKIFKELFHFN
ncbi:MAG: AAA family ATPase, partial [Anaerotignaceae bacterium]